LPSISLKEQLATSIPLFPLFVCMHCKCIQLNQAFNFSPATSSRWTLAAAFCLYMFGAPFYKDPYTGLLMLMQAMQNLLAIQMVLLSINSKQFWAEPVEEP